MNADPLPAPPEEDAMNDQATEWAPAYKLPAKRAADDLAEHLSRIPEQRLSIEGFRIPVSELFGMICHAAAHLGAPKP